MFARIRVALVAAMLGTAGMAACDDPTGITASYAVITDTLQLYSLNTAPAGAPNALYLFGYQLSGSTAVRAGSGLAFDVALDVRPDGQVNVFPVRRVANALAAGHRVGLQKVAGTFDQLTRAPTAGYTYDSTMVVPVGQVVAIDVTETSACAYSYLSTSVYGKLVVDSVQVPTGRMWVRFTSNPNCGFRSFAPGVPKD